MGETRAVVEQGDGDGEERQAADLEALGFEVLGRQVQEGAEAVHRGGPLGRGEGGGEGVTRGLQAVALAQGVPISGRKLRQQVAAGGDIGHEDGEAALPGGNEGEDGVEVVAGAAAEAAHQGRAGGQVSGAGAGEGVDEADGPAVEGGELGGGLIGGGEVAVDPLRRGEARDGDAVQSQEGEDARLQGVQGQPGGVAGEQHLAVVEGDGRPGPGRLSPGAVEVVRQAAHQLGAEVGVLFAAGLEVGPHQHAHAAGLRMDSVDEGEGVPRPRRVGAAVGVQQAQAQRPGPR